MESIPQVHQQAGGRCNSSRPTLVSSSCCFSCCTTTNLSTVFLSVYFLVYFSVYISATILTLVGESIPGVHHQEGATPVDAGRSSVVCLCCCTGTTSPVATTGESRDRHWRSPDTRSTLVCGALKIAFKGFSSEKGDMRVKELGDSSENSWLAEHEILW